MFSFVKLNYPFRWLNQLRVQRVPCAWKVKCANSFRRAIDSIALAVDPPLLGQSSIPRCLIAVWKKAKNGYILQASEVLTPSQWRDYATSAIKKYKILFPMGWKWEYKDIYRFICNECFNIIHTELINFYTAAPPIRHRSRSKFVFPYLCIKAYGNHFEMMKLEHFERE